MESGASADVRSVARRLYFCVTLIAAALALPLLAYLGWMKPALKSPGSWFQRSGALTTLAAAWVQVLLLRFQSNVTLTGFVKTTVGCCVPELTTNIINQKYYANKSR